MKRGGIGAIRLVKILSALGCGLFLAGMVLFMPTEHGGVHLDFVTLTAWGLALACFAGAFIIDGTSRR